VLAVLRARAGDAVPGRSAVLPVRRGAIGCAPLSDPPPAANTRLLGKGKEKEGTEKRTMRALYVLLHMAMQGL